MDRRVAFSKLRKVANADPGWLEFGSNLELDPSKIEDTQDMIYSALCATELIRIFYPNLPFQLNDCLDLFIKVLPEIAAVMPEEGARIFQTFQWHSITTDLEDQDTAVKWLQLFESIIDVNPEMRNTLKQLAASAANNCHVELVLALVLEAPEFWVSVVQLMDDLPLQIALYFDSCAQNFPDSLADVQFFANLARAAPKILGDYRFPGILNHKNPRIRALAVTAYANLGDFSEPWLRLASDKDADVREEWAETAKACSIKFNWSRLYCDRSANVRQIALSVQPLNSQVLVATALAHRDSTISQDAFRALTAQESATSPEYEAILKYLSRKRSRFNELIRHARPLLDKSRELALGMKGSSFDTLMWVNNKIYVFYSGYLAYNRATDSSVQAKALAKWLTSLDKFWHPLNEMELKVDEFASTFEKLVTPLFPDVEWLFRMAWDHVVAQQLLVQMAAQCPQLLEKHLPAITADLEPWMLEILVEYTKKVPLKLVNPAPQILSDLCLDSESSYQAAQVLYQCVPAYFEAIGPEILENVLQYQAEGIGLRLRVDKFKTLLVVRKVTPVFHLLDANEPASAPVYAATCPDENEVIEWLGRIIPTVEHDIVVETLIEYLHRDQPTSAQSFPLIAEYMSPRVAKTVAKLARKNPQLIPLLCFEDDYLHRDLKPRVFSAFCRLLYILGCNMDTRKQPIEVFIQRFVTQENASSMVELAKRMNHFSLKNRASSQGLYSAGECATKLLNAHCRKQKWPPTQPQLIEVPADCFVPLDKTTRLAVSREFAKRVKTS